MVKKIIIILIGLVVIIGVIYLIQHQSTPTPEPVDSQLVYYYGIGCPHCTNVEAFFEENKIEEKVPLTKKEIFYNTKNSNELSARASKCNIPADQVGVPFLWDASSSSCLVGDVDIINFFKQKLGLK